MIASGAMHTPADLATERLHLGESARERLSWKFAFTAAMRSRAMR